MAGGTVPIDPGAAVEFDLPDKLKLAIADCVTTFAKLENVITETIWALEEANLERKRELQEPGHRQI